MRSPEQKEEFVMHQHDLDDLDHRIMDLMDSVRQGEGWCTIEYVLQYLFFVFSVKYDKDLVLDHIDKLGYLSMIHNEYEYYLIEAWENGLFAGYIDKCLDLTNDDGEAYTEDRNEAETRLKYAKKHYPQYEVKLEIKVGEY